MNFLVEVAGGTAGGYNHRKASKIVKNSCPGKNNFFVNKLFVPVHLYPFHWSLIVVFMKEHKVKYYNALRWNGTK